METAFGFFSDDSDELSPGQPQHSARSSQRKHQPPPSPEPNFASARPKRSTSQPPKTLSYSSWTQPKLLKTLIENGIPIPTGADREELFKIYCNSISATPVFPASKRKRVTLPRKHTATELPIPPQLLAMDLPVNQATSPLLSTRQSLPTRQSHVSASNSPASCHHSTSRHPHQDIGSRSSSAKRRTDPSISPGSPASSLGPPRRPRQAHTVSPGNAPCSQPIQSQPLTLANLDAFKTSLLQDMKALLQPVSDSIESLNSRLTALETHPDKTLPLITTASTSSVIEVIDPNPTFTLTSATPADPLYNIESRRITISLALCKQIIEVDSTIVALVQSPPVGGLPKDPACPNSQCKVTEAHLKKSFVAGVQVTRLANTASLLTAYLDGILQTAPLPEPVASELRLVSGTLLQISSCKDRVRRWRPPVARTVTRMVPIPTSLLGDLMHRLQTSVAASSQTFPQGWGSTGRGAPTQQHSRRQFHRRPRQPLQQAPPQPQQPKQGP
ncbi:UNVERIFIED_CONTAM: hypothetical protein FKN15_033691 [Acipenser sinensis]